jgi:hypothetical protein
MTLGERMVWAAAWVRHMAHTGDWVASARWSAVDVNAMRALGRSDELRAKLTDDELAMLDDMLGTGHDRLEIRAIGGQVVGELEVPR